MNELAAAGTASSIAVGGVCALLLFVGLLVFGICALVKGLHVAKRASGGESSAGYCGHCGYDIRGVTSFECPECGSDLREVGIIRNVKKKGMTWLILGGISLGLLFVVMVFMGLLLVGKS